MTMEKQKESWPTEALINYFLYFFSLLTVVLFSITGLLVLPYLGLDEMLLGFTKSSWESLHQRLILIFLCLVMGHLYRHREWIKAITKKELGGWNPKTKLILSVTFMTLTTYFIILLTALFERS